MKLIRTTAAARLALIFAAVLFLGASSGWAGPTFTPTTFSTAVPQPNGIAISTTLFLVTSSLNTNTIYSLNGAGSVIGTSTVPVAGDVVDQEMYLAVVPGSNDGWVAGDIYAARGTFIWKIASGSTLLATPTLLTTMPPPCFDSQHVGITFDQTGTFNYNMIITCGDEYTPSEVFTVDNSTTPAAPIVTPLASLGFDVTEGPAVAPTTFCPAASCTAVSGGIGGAVFVAKENENDVIYVKPGGANAVFPGTPIDPEAVVLVPSTVCTYGTGNNAGGGFFSVRFNRGTGANGTIDEYQATDFTGLGGNLLVPLEFPSDAPDDPFGNIKMINGATGVVTDFDVTDLFEWNREGSAFVQCPTTAMMPLTKLSTKTFAPPPTGGFTFGLYGGTPTTAGTPNGYVNTAPNYGSLQQAVVPPTDNLTVTLPFAGTVCELDFPTGWTFSSFPVTFTPTISGQSASAPYVPTGAPSGSQQHCVDLVVPVGTMSVALNVTDAPPPLTVTISTAIYIEDSSIVTPVGGGPTPTGTVTYTFYNTINCMGTPVSTQTVTLVGGVPPNSALIGPFISGVHSYSATYNGDPNYAPSSPSPCEPVSFAGAG